MRMTDMLYGYSVVAGTGIVVVSRGASDEAFVEGVR